MTRKLLLIIPLILFSHTVFALPVKSGPGLTRIHIEGPHLVNDLGELVHLRGVCKNDFIEDPWGLMGGEEGVIANLDVIQSWGCNFFAPGVITDNYLMNAGGVRDNFKRMVHLAGERGIYVAIGAFGSRTSEWGHNAASWWLANPQRYINFWLAISNDFKNVSNVIYCTQAEVGFGLPLSAATGLFSNGIESEMDDYFALVCDAVRAMRNNGDEHPFFYHEDYCHCPVRFTAPATEGGYALRRIEQQPLDLDNPLGPKLSNVGYEAHCYRYHGTFGHNPNTFDRTDANGMGDNGVIHRNADAVDNKGIEYALEYWGWLKILNEYNCPIVMYEGGAWGTEGTAEYPMRPGNSPENELAAWTNIIQVLNELDISYAAFWWRPSLGWALINSDLSPTEWGQVVIHMIPEFQPFILLSLFLIATSMAALIFKRKQRTLLPGF